MTTRILHLVSSLETFSAARQVLELAGPLEDCGFRSSIGALAGNGELAATIQSAGHPFVHIRRRWATDPIALFQFVKQLRRIRPRIIHAWDATACTYAALARRWFDAALVGQLGSADNARSRRWVAAADRLIAPHDLLASQFSDSHWSDKVVVVRPGCEPPTASDTREEVCRGLGVPVDSKLIGVFGPLEPRYGVKELIWIADMVRELHPTLRLLIVGDGPERPHLEKFARTAAVPENICFLGDRTDWRTLLPHLHVFWQGSNAEMDPPALVDAMAAGIPVLATDTQVHRCYLKSNDTGQLADFGDRAVWTRLTDQWFNEPELAEQIGTAGREFASENFSIATQAASLAKLYRDISR